MDGRGAENTQKLNSLYFHKTFTPAKGDNLIYDWNSSRLLILNQVFFERAINIRLETRWSEKANYFWLSEEL